MDDELRISENLGNGGRSWIPDALRITVGIKVGERFVNSACRKMI